MKPFLLILALVVTVSGFLQFASRLFSEQKNLVSRVRIANEKKAGSEETSPFQDLNGMLNFSSDFKGLSIVPTINVWATQAINTNKGKVSFEAFIGISKHDSLLYNSSLKLFLPEASQYGFSFKGQHILKRKIDSINSSALYFNWQANILGKSFVYQEANAETKSDESSLLFHPKVGLDVVVADGLIDFYGNINALVRLTNVEKFDKTFNNSKDVNYFFDIGLGVMANLEKSVETKNTVYLQLGGILKGLDANNFAKTKDLLIPTFKITLISKLASIKPKKATIKNNILTIN